jgi:hypothetical protein
LTECGSVGSSPHRSPPSARCKEQTTMTLRELSETLPNGFHDAVVHTVTLDYSKHEVKFDIAVWVGELGAKDEAKREAYRNGELILSGVAFCVIEPPDPTYPYDKKDGIIIDTGEVRSLSKPPALQLPPVPEGLFLNWVYVREWNSFMYVVARNAQFLWYRGEKQSTEQLIAPDR